MNTQQRGVDYFRIPVSKWSFNADSRVDVAVAPVPFLPEIYDYKFLPLDLFVNEEVIAKEEIGIGDDIVFPGLFTHHPGENVNLPIIRIGNIAAMPSEPLETKWGWLRPPYLVEARSIGGISGSPVFYSAGTSRILSGNIALGRGIRFYLLGLVHGHYGAKEESWDSDDGVSDRAETRSVNMGIAIVVPANDILATLDQPELQSERDAESQKLRLEKNLSQPVPVAVAEPPIEVNQEFASMELADLASNGHDPCAPQERISR